MISDLPNGLAEGATVVVGSGLAARQLEPFLARTAAATRSNAWVGAALPTYQTWTTALWSRTTADPRQHLTAPQSLALWRQTIDNSVVAERLINSHSASRWAADAWRALLRWRIEPRNLSANDADLDFKSFLQWARDYRSALNDHHWIDSALTAFDLTNQSSLRTTQNGPVIWADISEFTPEQQALYRQLDQDGWTIAEWQPPAVQRSSYRVRLADSASELRAAAKWASERLTRTPDQRLALVIPEFGVHRHEVRRALDDILDPNSVLLGSATNRAYFDPGGEPCDLQPPIGAAMTSLELISSRGTFNTLSRWLRSPYIASEPGEESARSVLESSLRTTLSAQLGFLDAYNTGGLARRFHDAVPGLARRLSEAIKALNAAPQYATPTQWGRVWQQVLALLGWPAGLHDPNSAVRPLWESALNELALLTPIVGTLSMSEALAEMDLILAQPRPTGPIPLTGLSLLERPEDVGPGYDAVWVTGLTDAHWPRPARINPLLPLRLQRDHSMPGASPREALERCQRATTRLIERTPELIFSWPSRVLEIPTEPSPLLATIPEIELKTLVSTAAPRLAERMARTRPRESRADPAPRMQGQEIHGGAGTLSVQARCPLRAFIESRLYSRPLEPVSRGLSARQRGVITHRTLELFLRHLPGRTDLDAWTPAAGDEWALSCVEQALDESFGRARSLLPVLYELERDRLLEVLASLLANDLKRAEFRVAAVEEKQVAEIKNLRLNCRLDRIDALSAGGVAIIDYKTGRDTSPANWFKARLRDTQLPLYTQIPGAQVTATIIAAVHADGIQFKGVWAQKGDFPGQMTKLPGERTWPEQLKLWRQQLEVLVAEYAAGDTRILLTDVEEARGPFAPLTRIHEQLALARGWIDSWTEP